MKNLKKVIALADVALLRIWTTVMVAALSIMMLCALAQVVMRIGWAGSWPPFADIIGYAFTIATFSGAAVLFRGRYHLAIDFFVDLMPTRARRVAAHLSDVIVLLACLWLAYLSIGMIESGANQYSPTLGFSLSLIYVVVPISLLSSAFFLVLHGFRLDSRAGLGEAQTMPEASEETASLSSSTKGA